MTTDKTAIIYARVSNARNAEDGLPIESQIDACEKKAKSLGASVINTYVDNGISGTTDARPAFLDAFLFCELKTPDYFITWSPERFARNKMHAALYKQKLAEASVRLIYVSMDIDTETLGGWFLDGILDVVNEYQALRVGVDVRRSMAKVARDGYWTGGRPPFGYKIVPANDGSNRKKMIPSEEEALIVNEIFTLKTVQHIGCRAIANLLNARGILNRGNPWSKSTISYLLNHRAMIGQVVYGKRDRLTGRRRPLDQCVVIDSHEPIISRDLWEKTQQALKLDKENTDSSRANSHFLLTGLLKCHCGSGAQIESAGGRSKRYWYYKCRAAAERKTHPTKRLAAREFDYWILQQVCDRLITESTISELIREIDAANSKWDANHAKRRNAILRQISGVKQKMDNLYSLLEDKDSRTLNISDLSPRLREHRTTLSKLEKQLNDVDSAVPPVINTDSLNPASVRNQIMASITGKNIRKTRSFLKTIINHIVLVDDEARIHYNSAALISGGEGGVGGSGSPHVLRGPYQKTEDRGRHPKTENRTSRTDFFSRLSSVFYHLVQSSVFCPQSSGCESGGIGRRAGFRFQWGNP